MTIAIAVLFVLLAGCVTCLVIKLVIELVGFYRRQRQYILVLEQGVDELHGSNRALRDQLRAGQLVMYCQLDRINNLQQANSQLLYILNPDAPIPVSARIHGYDA